MRWVIVGRKLSRKSAVTICQIVETAYERQVPPHVVLRRRLLENHFRIKLLKAEIKETLVGLWLKISLFEAVKERKLLLRLRRRYLSLRKLHPDFRFPTQEWRNFLR